MQRSFVLLRNPVLLGFAILWGGLSALGVGAYLSLEGRGILQWDAAMHFRDGFLLYQQLMQGDLVSFVVQIFKFSYWLPLHPLLVAAGNFLAPFNFDVPVLLNFVFLMVASLLSAESLSRAFRHTSLGSRLGTHLYFLGITWLLVIRGELGAYLGVLMLEMLSYALTLLLLATLVEACFLGTAAPFKRASQLLLGLFLTKVNYGIYGSLPFAVVFLARSGVLSFHAWKKWRGNVGPLVREILSSRSFRGTLLLYLGLTGALLVRGLKKGSWGPLHDWVWLQLFAPLVFWTFFRGKERVFSLCGEHWRSVSQWLVLPFGWLYLFPIRHKVATFFELSAHMGEPIPFLKRAGVLVQGLSSEFFRVPVGVSAGIFLALMLGLGWHAWRSGKEPMKSAAFLGLFAFLGGFYGLMSFFSHRHESRVLFPWLAGWVLSVAVLGLRGRVSSGEEARVRGLRSAGKTLGLGTAVGLLALSVTALELPTLSTRLRQGWMAHSLLGDYQQIERFRQVYRFDQPGLIHGLGMDAVAPMIDLWCRRAFPEMSSYLRKPEDRPCFPSDFGVAGNPDPVGFVAKKIQEPRYHQVGWFYAQGAPQLPRLREVLRGSRFERVGLAEGLWEVWRRSP